MAIITISRGSYSKGKEVAEGVAERLGYLYLDSGALYRAVTLAALRRKADFSNPGELAEIARTSRIASSRTRSATRNARSSSDSWCMSWRGWYWPRWSRSTGRVLSYVIGGYPNASTCPYILNSANQPESEWPNIWQNLRIYGSAEGWENNHECMNERMFSLVP